MSEKLPTQPILFVDDEEDALAAYQIACKYDGINNIILCQDSRQVKELLAAQPIALAILDLSMPHISGQELMKFIAEEYPAVPVIIITANSTVEEAVQCMKQGAVDYLIKPVERNRLSVAIAKAIEVRELKNEVEILSKNIMTNKVQNPGVFASILTQDASMKAIFKYVESIARSSKPVLITGESGVGKEMIARAIHRLSGCTGDFVALNIAGLDDTLFSDTIFGHEKGAFSGAGAKREGFLQLAEKGILFLDEIGDLDKGSQIKLLRLLQENEFYALGSDARKTFSARIIAATNVDLTSMISEKKFRNDLYHRLSTHLIHIPPLRDRIEDLPLLVRFFAGEAATALGKPEPAINPGLYSHLKGYTFPGNVRELQSMIYDMVARHETGALPAECFDDYIRDHAALAGRIVHGKGGLHQLKDTEDRLLLEAMVRARNNQSLAAKLLGISQSTISRRMKKLLQPQARDEELLPPQ
jgi:DNA-binding NtrC family response regulator